MKKSLILAMMAIIVASCTAKEPKVLVTYFSVTETTKSLAQELAASTGADLFQIDGVQPYTSDDVDFRNRESRSVKEMADKSIRPELKGKPEKLDKYDVVFIGFPIWGDAAPNIIYSFIDQNDLKGKTIITFSTSGSSNLTNSFKKLKDQYSDLKLVEGTTLKRNPTPQDRENVLKTLKEAIPAE